jgi:dihydrofolate synthase/folylpolyglutamate synthase
MDYQTALNWVLSFADYERFSGFAYSSRFDLRRMEELMKQCGQSNLSPRTVHIAGSKGKGSTAAMIASALYAAGHKTGLYTSPHLHTIRERIAVDGKPIPEQEMADLVARLKPAAEALNREGLYGETSTFELLTALAFLYFQQVGVEFQVLEAGLGGRLDATNIVQPEVCIITSISLDHTEVLGNSIAQIAWEKAGIIKPGAVVVSSPQREEAASVIAEVCHKMGARLINVGEEATWHKTSSDIEGQSFSISRNGRWYDLTIPLLGEHQLENAATAVACLEALGIPKEGIVSGLAQVQWQGRLEVLRQEPLLIVDGAHNADSARRLREALEQLFHFRRAILIMGTSCDKDIAGTIAELVPLFDTAIITRSQHPRAADPQSLAEEFAKYKVKVLVAEEVEKAISKALQMAKKEDLICATGSLFLVAEVREWAKGFLGERYARRS